MPTFRERIANLFTRTIQTKQYPQVMMNVTGSSYYRRDNYEKQNIRIKNRKRIDKGQDESKMDDST